MFTPIDQSTWPRWEHFTYYRNTLPCSLNISHAAVDGWHISQFFQGVQDLLDTVNLTAEG